MSDELQAPQLLPGDPYDLELRRHTHPPQWRNPTPRPVYGLVVIGGGTAGLVSAGVGAILGARVALVERAYTGGDCLVTGCVPSKSVLRSARAAAEVRGAERYGVRVPAPGPDVDFAAAMDRMRAVRARIGGHDDAAAFRDKYGVDVFFGDARFVGPDRVDVGGQSLRFRRAVVATGSRPAVPPIAGLAAAGFYTNETIFNLTERPARVAVVGGGPLGCELAQAFARLGSRVTVLQHADQLVPREDADAAAVLLRVFEREGIRVHLGATVDRVGVEDGAKVLYVKRPGREERVPADAVLVAAGRVPNVEGLDLEVAGVRHGDHGVDVDDYLRTTNRRIFAAGDVCLREKFTHTADASARLAVQNALLFPFKRWSRQVVPNVTFTDPEIAHVGLHEWQATERGQAVETYSVPLEEVDRALTDGAFEGFFKLHIRRGSGRIVGATIVADHAGEMLSQVTLAIVAGTGLNTLADVIFPYPTQSEALKKIADRHVTAGLKGWKNWALRRWTRTR
jgi:pyruvate/2-oxoglutarate dehydrogenase complex dihydrolipoamide dehydrogenase (E3) component